MSRDLRVRPRNGVPTMPDWPLDPPIESTGRIRVSALLPPLFHVKRDAASDGADRSGSEGGVSRGTGPDRGGSRTDGQPAHPRSATVMIGDEADHGMVPSRGRAPDAAAAPGPAHSHGRFGGHFD